jgi:1,4-dihydroxy-2-naphthoyl-CoA hydrolase
MYPLPNDKTLLGALGIEITECTRERVVATMPVHAPTHQPYGLLHGGASVALAETVASTAAWMNIDQATEMAVGLEINANHLRGKREGMVTATALPVHIGRRTQVWQIEIVDEAGKAVCSSRCTIAVVQRG